MTTNEKQNKQPEAGKKELTPRQIQMRKKMVAVSYTHLDVYKRQRQYWEQGTHVVLVDTGNSYQGLCELIRRKTKGEAVSYTHLAR